MASMDLLSRSFRKSAYFWRVGFSINCSPACMRGLWVSERAVIWTSGWDLKERVWMRPMRPKPMMAMLMRSLAPRTREVERAVVIVRAAVVLRKFLREKFLKAVGLLVFIDSLDGEMSEVYWELGD